LFSFSSLQQGGSTDDYGRQLAVETAQKIQQIQTEAKQHAEEVIHLLLKCVSDVNTDVVEQHA